MRKRLTFLWTPLVIGLALMLPASTTATSYGQISYSNFYCSGGGSTVNVTFKMHKNSGFYATKLTLTMKGQGWHNGHWVDEYNIGTDSKIVNTNGTANFTRYAWFTPGHAGKHRLNAVGRIWDGSYKVAQGSIHSGTCQ
ncbi:MAG TPA: hypothetical protein VM284_04325 [Candidatus Limnocylindria bacterium]|nr:hypothetical protein [Candidatus Limnocylindria bacterium]